jgi:hypothetical protein
MISALDSEEYKLCDSITTHTIDTFRFSFFNDRGTRIFQLILQDKFITMIRDDNSQNSFKSQGFFLSKQKKIIRILIKEKESKILIKNEGEHHQYFPFSFPT